MTFNIDTPCAYSAERNCVIDLFDDDGLTKFSRDTIDEVRERYPDAVTLPLSEAAERIEATFKSEPVEIERETYEDMFEVLPPVDYSTGQGWRSFKMCERTSGNVTAIYATDGARYFHLSDSIYTPHDEIVRRCRAAFPRDQEQPCETTSQ